MGCGGGRSYIPYPFPVQPVSEPEERRSTKDILKMRLARGEITIIEYHEMLNALQGDASPRPQRKKSHIRMP